MKKALSATGFFFELATNRFLPQGVEQRQVEHPTGTPSDYRKPE